MCTEGIICRDDRWIILLCESICVVYDTRWSSSECVSICSWFGEVMNLCGLFFEYLDGVKSVLDFCLSMI